MRASQEAFELRRSLDGARGHFAVGDADGNLFRLVSEALRIRLAYLFDPYLAVHTSNLDALPHQIRAVYGECSRASRFASCSRTIRVRARPSWPGSSSRSSWSGVMSAAA